MQVVAKVRPIPRRAKILYFPSPASATTGPKRQSITTWPIWLVFGVLVSIIGEIWSARW